MCGLCEVLSIASRRMAENLDREIKEELSLLEWQRDNERDLARLEDDGGAICLP